MQEPFIIKKVAVLGAGVMGAQIAAHITNAGIETCLFDLASEGNNPYEIVKGGIQKLTQLKPSPLATKETTTLIRACQYRADLGLLADCDLVIEAIAERLDWKEALYQQIAPYLGPKTILVSNTSGLSINQLVSVLPESLQTRFCGVHFFNPPRYMHLVELIGAQATQTELLDKLETWLTRYLGKGVIRAKDTPNFIANRIGVFSLLTTLYHTERLGLGFDVADALTGTLLGRPKSATYRTMDVVGLDTLQHVVHTMQTALTHDPWHAYFCLPEWLEKMIQSGHLGQKTGGGIYRKRGQMLEVYDIRLNDYRPLNAAIPDEIKAIFKLENQALQFKALCASTSPEAQLIIACLRDTFHYASFHLASIANNVRDVDLALQWGFGWQQGPFETWQAFGTRAVTEWLQGEISNNHSMSSEPLPAWLFTDNFTFYQQEKAFAPAQATYLGRSQLKVYQRQLLTSKTTSTERLLYENQGVVLSSLQDDIAMLSFKSKANTIGQAVIDGLSAAIEIVEARCQGLIVYQHNPLNFSSGADLSEVLKLIENHQMAQLAQMVRDFQQVLMTLKYSTIPVVGAVRGRALGGGCELLMHCDAVIAAFESYPGLVEAGVGLIPAGGGSKELARAASTMTTGEDVMPRLHPYFEQIMKGVVAGSAAEAKQLGYLRATDHFVMHANEVLYVALHRILAMQAANYLPGIPPKFKVAGRAGCAQFKGILANFKEGRFISEHDAYLGEELAYVLTGGDVDAGTIVDEAWILRLEHEAFMRLAETPLTQARIRAMLENGKPLRN